jgi:RNA polymerase sigma factor (sigma-70 family)
VAALSTNGLADDPRARVAAVAQRHERTLLRVARQASLCQDDALDAYQRALEIFVRRVDTVDPATEVAWLKVVIRHEAMAIRRARSESVTSEELDLDAFVPATNRSVDDEIAATERVRRSAEALRALKPDEAKALMMKANGLSYDEIGELNGWSYTKVNRAVTEGRRRFLAAFEGIESGKECERFAPVVEALAAGSASVPQVVSIRAHLRHCSTCRAAIRDLHLSRIRRASLFWPGFLLAAESTRSEQERLLHTLAESGTPVDGTASRLTDLKHRILEFVHRAQASDVATGVQIAASGGGGRIASVATVIALCLSSAGAATICVVGNLVDRGSQSVEQSHSPQTGPSRRDRHKTGGQASSTAPPASSGPSTTGALTSSRSDNAPMAITKRRRASDAASKRGGKTRDLAQEEFGFERDTTSRASTTPTSAPASQPIATSATTHASDNNHATAPDPAQEEFGP